MPFKLFFPLCSLCPLWFVPFPVEPDTESSGIACISLSGQEMSID
jgi:hypothetical protein